MILVAAPIAFDEDGVVHCPNDSGATTGGVGIYLNSDSTAFHNVISMDSTGASSYGIRVGNTRTTVIGNTIFNQAAGTGSGIWVDSSARDYAVYLNNIVCGFSGTGGIGIEMNGSDTRVYGHNKFWNNSTNIDLGAGFSPMDLGSNTALGSNPFVSTGNADPNDDDFELVDPIEGLDMDLYNPDGAFSGNLSYLDAGALFRAVTAPTEWLPAHSMQMKYVPRRMKWGAVPYR